jgi:hypothetical protein
MTRFLAEAVVVVHLAFVVFVALGGLLVARWPRLAWLHVPAAAWGVMVEWAGWICPLTPLENAMRARGGGSAYTGDFVDRYMMPLLPAVVVVAGAASAWLEFRLGRRGHAGRFSMLFLASVLYTTLLSCAVLILQREAFGDQHSAGQFVREKLPPQVPVFSNERYGSFANLESV